MRSSFESLGALKAAQDAGKIRHGGLSEVMTVAEIERAKRSCRLSASRTDTTLLTAPRRPRSTTARKKRWDSFHGRRSGGASRSLSKASNPLEAEAKRHNVSVVQLALAWLLQRSPVMLPIPGTSSLAHLEENMAAAKLQLSADEWKKIEALARTS